MGQQLVSDTGGQCLVGMSVLIRHNVKICSVFYLCCVVCDKCEGVDEKNILRF